MSFSEKLESVKSRFQSEFNLLLQFVNTTERTLTEKFEKITVPELTDDDKGKMGQLISFVDNGSDVNGLSIESEAIAKLLMSRIVPIKHKSYLNEMALSYLISFQEALLKDYLYIILINNINCLKSKTSIQYKTLLDFSSIEQLHEHIVKHEVDTIGYGSIDDMAQYFQDKFNMSFNSFGEWEALVEATYRRNLFIHNQGICNDKYQYKFPEAVVGKHMHFDCTYVNDSVQRLMKFNEYLFDNIVEKFKIEA